MTCNQKWLHMRENVDPSWYHHSKLIFCILYFSASLPPSLSDSFSIANFCIIHVGCIWSVLNLLCSNNSCYLKKVLNCPTFKCNQLFVNCSGGTFDATELQEVWSGCNSLITLWCLILYNLITGFSFGSNTVSEFINFLSGKNTRVYNWYKQSQI